jgi:hypothetical protein
MDVMNIADRIRYKKIIEDSLSGIDFLFSPDLEAFAWGDFTRCLELVRKGEEEVYKYEKQLLRALKKQKIKEFFFLNHILKK